VGGKEGVRVRLGRVSWSAAARCRGRSLPGRRAARRCTGGCTKHRCTSGKRSAGAYGAPLPARCGAAGPAQAGNAAWRELVVR
jgi:hypothetical protein